MSTLALARSIVLLGVETPALAQSAADPARPPGVVVTGSDLSRADTATGSPVQVIPRADIVRTGARTVKELIDPLASVTGALSDLNRAER